MNWQEVLLSNHETVTVQSYGYTERSFFNSHFEPFRNKRSFKFKIERGYNKEGKLIPEYCSLEHKWLFLEEPEKELFFEEKDGEIILDDPDLWARPD